MLSKWKLAVVILCLLPLAAMAQEQPKGFSVDSSPPGAEVSLIGAITLNGLTPVRFTQALEGNYQVRVKKYGYETYKSSVFLQADRDMNLTVRLSPKTRFKAAARSLLIPGWGQSYTEQKTKGAIFMIMAAGAIASYLIADADFKDKNDHYKLISSEYDNATSYEEKVRLYPQLGTAKKDAYDAENIRRITIGATVAVWGLNLLDVLFFFPEETGSLSVNSIGLKPDLKSGGAQLVLSHRF
jgi:PEGA domain/Family of unknown function (DUF5683)